MFWSTFAAAQTSAYCPAPLTATVPNGGSVAVDVSTCDGVFDGGMSGPIAPFALHGTVTIGPNSGGVQFVTYAHNGDSATSDSFTLEDEDLGTVIVNITISAPTSSIVVAPAVLPTLTAGTPFSQTLTSTGGTAPYTYTLNAGSLPVGLSLTSGGVLSGTPTQRGAYSFSVQSQDSTLPTNDTVIKSYSGTVQNPTLSISPSSATAIQNVAFSQSLTPTGGVAPHSYLLESGSFPAGISISGAGVISGTTAAAPGNYPVTIRVTDASTGPGSYFELESFTLTVSALPALTINDVTLNETNSGTTTASFTVSLNAPAGAGGVTFDIATANNTATTADLDYVATSLTGQTIAAGNTTYTFNVLVNGDTKFETNETFFVNVTNVTGAIVTDGQGLGTITNDDAQPSIAIDDVGVTEGNSGTVNAVFTVTLSNPSYQTVGVNFATANGTATLADNDYVTNSGALTFTTGQTSQTITVVVNGDQAPEANETFTVGLSGQSNASISDGSGTGTITNDDTAVTVSPGSLPAATVAAAYSQTITASGGNGPYTFAVTAGALPAGLSLSSGGALTGTPTAGGSFNFTVTATDSSTIPGPNTGSQAFTLTVNAPTISLPATSLAGGTLGVAYSQSITAASGGTAPYSYAVTAGALPGGLILNFSTGAITGTPNALGTFNFSITATDSSTGTGPYTATQSYSITVIDVPPVANAVSATVAYGSGANPITLNITGGTATSVAIGTAASNGTAIASGTSITYQPTAGYAGPDSFTYTATNSGGTSAPATVTITVSDPVITVTAGGSLSATVAVAYSQTFTWNGGAQPWSGYQVTNLPAGLSITGTTANSVTISGTPTQAGSFSLNASATDSSTGNGPFTVGQAFTLTVAAPVLTMTPAPGTLTATYGSAYSQTFTAGGGTGPYTYQLTGALPAGVSFSGDTLSGTPTAPGSYPITVTATDTGSTGTGSPFTIAQNYTLNVPAPTIVLAPATLPAVTAGNAYSQTITASGGIGPYSFAVTSGSLPTGLSLASGGALTGTPTEVGTFNITVTATDANGQTGSRAYTLDVDAPTLTMTPAPGTLTAPYAVVYSQAFTAGGSPGPYNYVLTGALPAGVTFSGNTLSGTPTAPGSYPITVTATDTTLTGVGAPFSIAQNYTLDVPAPTITISPSTLPGTTAGQSYNQTLTASGAIAPYTFAVTAGALPPGLTISSAGVLSGTATSSGTFNFTVTASDVNAQTGSQAYSLVVAVPTLILTPATLPSGVSGTAYSQTFVASGGIAPYTLSLTGTLPTGLSFNAGTGVLSGTPTQSGSFNISVTATDSTGGTAATVTNNYTLVIAVPTLTLSPATVASGVQFTPYPSTQFTASGGVAPYSFAITAGSLPTGMSFSAAGLLSGTPTASGTFSFTVTATDSTTGTAGTVSRAYQLLIANLPDPSTDPEVRGLIESQIATTRRFANAQIGNFQQRMESLHSGRDKAGFSNQIGFSGAINKDCRSATFRFGSEACDHETLRAAGLNAEGGTAQPGESASFNFWAAGNIRSGNQDAQNGAAKFDFETDGLSIGADKRMSEAWAFGAGLGYGRDESRVGNNGTSNEGEAYTLAFYSSYHPNQTWFVDGLIGYQWMDYQLRRYVTANGNTVFGERDGTQWFASFTVGGDFHSGNWNWSPYARWNVARAELDAYGESGDAIYVLDYDELTIRSNTLSLGWRSSYDNDVSWGSFSPKLRLEYQHDFQGDTTTSMQYALVGSGQVYDAVFAGYDRNRWLFGLGADMEFDSGWRFMLEFQGTSASGSSTHGVQINLEKNY